MVRKSFAPKHIEAFKAHSKKTHLTKLLLCLLLIFATAFVFAGCGDEEEKLPTVAEMFDQSRGNAVLDVEKLPECTLDVAGSEGMKLVSSKGSFELYVDTETTDIMVYDSSASQAYFSNPKRAGTAELSSEAMNKNASLVEILYYDSYGKEGIYYSLKDAVDYGQFEFYEIPDGLRIVYTLGIDESNRLLPPVLTEKTYKKLYEQLTDDEKPDFKPLFRLIKKDAIPKKEAEDLLKNFPKLAEENLYLLRPLDKYSKRVLEGLLTQVGFTMEELLAEMEYCGFEREESNVTFIVPIDLAVVEDGFTAAIDSSYIAETVAKDNSYKISSAKLLPGFGATASENGFFFLPDGSGVTLKLHDEGTSAVMSKQIFGQDELVASYPITTPTMSAIIPVFAMKADDITIFGNVIEGEAVGTVTARRRAGDSPVAAAFVEMNVNQIDYMDTTSLMKEHTAKVYPNEHSSAKLKVKYSFVYGDDVDYVDLAHYYQSMLVEQGVLVKNNTTKMPVYFEFLGSIDKPKSYAGIPIVVDEKLTTYNQVSEIVDLFAEKGVDSDRVNAKLVGFFNDGKENMVYDKLRFISSLGGKSGYKELEKQMAGKNANLFIDTVFGYTYVDKFMDNFGYKNDASRKLDHKVAVKKYVKRSDGFPMSIDQRYLMSPVKMVDNATKFFEDYEKNGFSAGISLGETGKYLSSDYRIDANIVRDKAQQYYEEMYAIAEAAAGEVLVDVGNKYTWKYADHIMSLPSGSSQFYSQLEPVPFVQIVLHGYINYSGMPINLCSAPEYELLKTLETGSGIALQMMYAEDMVLIDTEYEYLYSLNYKNHLEIFMNVYNAASKVIDKVAGERIVSHKKLADKVFETGYENGVSVIVNYNDSEVEVGGNVVAANGYAVVEGGGGR